MGKIFKFGVEWTGVGKMRVFNGKRATFRKH